MLNKVGGWNMERTLPLLKALADESRLKIVKLLLQYNYCVGALARELQLTDAAVSQHLKVLREAGLVSGVKKGQYTHYAVDREQLKALATQFTHLAGLAKEECPHGEERCKEKE
jgi:ArsR family transcriptional regulator